ncbi:DUF5455 family protein [Marinobacter gelidimuriae]|uniref:DUF5455 family protein n=1 Tax=Marinobacter gelidimuriae TaxID=2739064 RepID=UPI0003631DC9|nr:DUF5455 family protein [Marinobacter gelidimuriae]
MAIFIASVLGAIGSGLAGFFAKFLTKRVAVVVVVVAAFVTVTGVFVAAIYALLNGIYVAFPDFGPVFMFLPSNTAGCFGAIVSAKTLKWAYDWNITIIQSKLV